MSLLTPLNTLYVGLRGTGESETGVLSFFGPLANGLKLNAMVFRLSLSRDIILAGSYLLYFAVKQAKEKQASMPASLMQLSIQLLSPQHTCRSRRS